MSTPFHSRAFWFRPWTAVLVAAVLVAAALAWLLALQRPMPPRTLVMATGPEGGAYAQLGPRYREILARAGITLRLLPTAGALENLARLRDARSGVSVAFVQAGATTAPDSPDLASLGSVFYEPFWVFFRGPAQGPRLQDLRGKRASLGPEGSGTRMLALRLLALDGIDTNSLTLFSLAPEEAAQKLLRGDIDAAAMLTSWDAPVVRQLLANPEVVLASFARADAFIALQPYLNKLVLPAGVGDLARNLPPADVVLLAPKASLVVRRDLHPALQFLLLEAASEIHTAPDVFQKAGQFPAPEGIDVPLSEDARHFYKSGRPWLQRHLPFWLAVLGEHLVVLLIPFAGVVYPMLRFLPPLYAWSMRRRIVRLYGELKLLEMEAEGASGEASALLVRLDELERRANRLRIPGPFAPLLYTFRHHLSLVRERLQSRATGVSSVTGQGSAP